MKLADRINEKMKKGESSANSLGALDKKAMGMVKELMEGSYADSNEDQMKMAEGMMKLAKMESKVANEFMKHMDEAASKYKMDEDLEEGKKTEDDDDMDDDDAGDDDGDDDEDMDDDKEKHKKKDEKNKK